MSEANLRRVLVAVAGTDAVRDELAAAGFEVVYEPAPERLLETLAGQSFRAAVLDPAAAGDADLEAARAAAGEHVPLIVLGGDRPPPEAMAGLPLVERIRRDAPPGELVERVRAGVAVSELIDRGARRSERLEALLEIARALNSTLDAGAILYIITRKLAQAMELGRCSFIVPDMESGIGRVIACKDDPDIHALEINLGNYPEIIRVLDTGERVIIEDVETDPIMVEVRRYAEVFRDQTIMTLPLKYHDRIIGVLQIRKKSQEKGFLPREIEYCELLANAAASALNNAQLYGDIEQHNKELRRQKRELEQLSSELQTKNAELVELQRMKADFTAMIVHDLRSPLMIVQGVLDLLGNKHRGNPAERELIDDGIRVTKKMLQLITSLLEVARIEAGELRLEPEEIPLKGLMRDAVQPFQVLAEGRDVGLRAEVEDGLQTVYADRSCLYQILDNLLSNACRFTPDGGSVTVRARHGGDGGVQLIVADTGCGIAPGDLPDIFKRFRQGKGEGGGAGLGLNIVDLLVAAHGGTVEVESEEGKGATFTVTLPAPGSSESAG